jgi:hypothetical protein
MRHQGVTVVEDLSAVTAYGIEESVWARGHVRGSIDADFLTPLPARTSFDENADWIALLDLLDRYAPTLDAEVASHLSAHREKQASDIERRALRIARDILDLDEFRDLALPGGLAKRGRPEPAGGTKTGKTRKAKPRVTPKDPGQTRSPEASGSDTAKWRSTTVHGRTAVSAPASSRPTRCIRITSARRVAESRLAYAALLVARRRSRSTIAAAAGDFLEKLLDFYFTLHARRPWRGRKPRETGGGDDQMELLGARRRGTASTPCRHAAQSVDRAISSSGNPDGAASHRRCRRWSGHTRFRELVAFEPPCGMSTTK